MTIEPLYTSELPYTYMGWLFKGGFFRAESTHVTMRKSDAITMQPALSDDARRQLVSYIIARERIRAEKAGRAG